MGGQVLKFRLSGINNQNFLMQDEQTGSWWQQVTGVAVAGPMKGQKLMLQPWDEVSFALWKHEHPTGQILQPEPQFSDLYAKSDWAQQISRLPTVTQVDPTDRFQPRDLIIGIEAGGAAKAYSLEDLRRQSPVLDVLGGVPLLILVDRDGASVRAFQRQVQGRTLELFQTTATPSTDPAQPPAATPSANPAQPATDSPLQLLDAETGSTWDFSGHAIAGPLAGQSLPRVQTLKDFWFDWKQYHPDTLLYSTELPGRSS